MTHRFPSAPDSQLTYSKQNKIYLPLYSDSVVAVVAAAVATGGGGGVCFMRDVLH